MNTTQYQYELCERKKLNLWIYSSTCEFGSCFWECLHPQQRLNVCRVSCPRRHGIEVKDFGISWRSGVAFHSVVHAIRPDLVDMEVVRRRSNRDNLEQAFSLAENELGIPRLLDPEGASVLPCIPLPLLPSVLPCIPLPHLLPSIFYPLPSIFFPVPLCILPSTLYILPSIFHRLTYPLPSTLYPVIL